MKKKAPNCESIPGFQESIDNMNPESKKAVDKLLAEHVNCTGVERIVIERLRQIEVEGFDAEHDEDNYFNELTDAAICYADPSQRRMNRTTNAPTSWPWNPTWWKPSPDDRIKELTKAGALIAAEIDRLLALQKISK